MKNYTRKMLRALSLTGAFLIAAATTFAQSATTGSIYGSVTDTTGAAALNLVSNEEGRFTAPFLKPDPYELVASAPGLKSSSTKVQILTGQQSAINIVVSPTAASQTVEVTANNAQLIDTQSANTTTTFTTEQFETLPAPGGDITTIA